MVHDLEALGQGKGLGNGSLIHVKPCLHCVKQFQISLITIQALNTRQVNKKKISMIKSAWMEL